MAYNKFWSKYTCLLVFYAKKFSTILQLFHFFGVLGDKTRMAINGRVIAILKKAKAIFNACCLYNSKKIIGNFNPLLPESFFF